MPAEPLDRVARRHRGRVRVPRQLQRRDAPEADRDERPHDRRPVELSLADLEVLVHPAARVVEVHVQQHRRVPPDRLVGRDRLGARHVADVEREAEVRRAHRVAERGPLGERLDEHPRLRLERDAHAERRHALAQPRHAVHHEPPRVVRLRLARRDARPDRDHVAAERRGHLGAAHEEVETARAPLGVRLQQGGAVLAARVEHVARPRLDDDREVERLEPTAHGAQLGVGRRVRREVVRVGRQRDGAVPQLGHDRQRVVEPVVREAVRVVAQPERRPGDAHPRLTRARPTRRRRSSAGACRTAGAGSSPRSLRAT